MTFEVLMKYVGYVLVFLAVFMAVFSLTLATPAEVSNYAPISGILAVMGVGLLINEGIK